MPNAENAFGRHKWKDVELMFICGTFESVLFILDWKAMRELKVRDKQ